MATCDRCGISAWHPEARACTFTDCAIRRAPTVPLAAANPKTRGCSFAGDPVHGVTGGFVAHQDHERLSA